MGKYQIKRTSNNQFRWILLASNGENLLTSESYTTKQSCLDGVASSKGCVADKNFDKKTSTAGQPYFNQIANNYQVHLYVNKLMLSSDRCALVIFCIIDISVHFLLT